MIISHRHRFIFIKTRKTAGTSIEACLSRFCGPEDVITPITLADEPIRGAWGVTAQNYLAQTDGTDRTALTRPVRRSLVRLVSEVELRRPGTTPVRLTQRLYNYCSPRRLKASGQFYNHMTAAEVIALIGVQTWSDYFTFCFDREPLAKTISDYRYRGGQRSFDEYLTDFGIPCDFDKYHVDGRLAVDFVGRHEALEEDLARAMARVGLQFDGWLPRAKAGIGRRGPIDLTEAQQAFVKDQMSRALAAATSRPETGTSSARVV